MTGVAGFLVAKLAEVERLAEKNRAEKEARAVAAWKRILEGARPRRVARSDQVVPADVAARVVRRVTLFDRVWGEG